MSRGRKPNQIIKNDWESIFLNSVGSYVQLINTLLSNSIKPEPLSNYIRIAGGYAFKSSNYSKEGIPVIRISDFSNERITIENVKFYKEDISLKKYELHTGDIVIALTGGTIAKLGIVQDGIGKLYLNQRVGKFEVLDDTVFESEYIYWIARSIQSIIKNLAWGAAIPNISPKKIEKLEFPIPKKETQKGIIEFLNDLKNNKIKNVKIYFNSDIEEQIILLHTNQVDGTNLTTQLNHQLSLVIQLRQSFLQEAMQGKLVEQNTNDEPATELLAKIKSEKEQLIKEKKIKRQKSLPPITKEEIPFEIPENWAWCRLGEVCFKITDGFHNTPPKIKEGFPYIAATQVKTNAIDWDNSHYVAEKYHRELYNKAYPKKGELLVVNIGAGCGTPAIIDVDYEFSFKNTAILKFNQRLLINKLLNYYFIWKRDEIYAELTKGGLQPFLSLTILNKIIIPLPPLSEQKRIVAKLDELMAYCDNLEKSIKISQTQNEMLLQQVLREALEPKEKEVVV